MWEAGRNMDSMLDQAFGEFAAKHPRQGMGQAPTPPPPPMMQPQQQAPAFFVPWMGNVPAPIVGAAKGITNAPPGTAGHKVKELGIAVLGGTTLAAIVLGGIWLARRIEHGIAKDGAKHLRFDAATLAPVITVGIMGALLILGARYVNRKLEADAAQKQVQQMQAQLRQPTPPMLPGPSPMMMPGMDPNAIIDEQLRQAQGQPGPFAQPPQQGGGPAGPFAQAPMSLPPMNI